MPRDETALHGTGASCQSGGWKYLEICSPAGSEMIERREQRRKESGLQQALLKAALAALEMTPSGSLWSVVLVFSSLGCFPKLWVATTENLSFRKILVSASGKLQHGIPLRCYLCSSPAEKLC